MEEQQKALEPKIMPTFNGWTAYGEGWAVYGRTREGALENYWRAEQRRREILALPPLHKQTEAEAKCRTVFVS